MTRTSIRHILVYTRDRGQGRCFKLDCRKQCGIQWKNMITTSLCFQFPPHMMCLFKRHLSCTVSIGRLSLICVLVDMIVLVCMNLSMYFYAVYWHSYPLCSVLSCPVPAPPLTVQFLISGKQRKIAKYYKKQENLLKDFSDMETMNELGGLDQNGPTEVQAQLQIYHYVVCDYGICTYTFNVFPYKI